MRRANVTDYRWHDFRHEFASRLAEAVVPLVKVRDLQGHRSVLTTERYDRQRAEQLKPAVHTLGPAVTLGPGRSFTILAHSVRRSDGAARESTSLLGKVWGE
jgi:hypothetical protein